MPVKKMSPVKLDTKDRLLAVLDWLYANDGNFESKNDWRDELVEMLFFLADLKRPDVEYDLEEEE